MCSLQDDHAIKQQLFTSGVRHTSQAQPRSSGEPHEPSSATDWQPLSVGLPSRTNALKGWRAGQQERLAQPVAQAQQSLLSAHAGALLLDTSLA